MKKVLITGASSGIGFACAKLFLTNGYRVVAQYNSNQKGINDLVEFANSIGMGENVFIYKVDFADFSKVSKFIQDVNQAFKVFDVVVNNAGVSLYELFTQTTPNDYDKIFNVNVKAPYFITQSLAKNMVSEQQGKIIFISSIWGNVGGSVESAYSASKSALIGLTKSLAKELGPSNINVNCICPGVIDTKMNSRLNIDTLEELCDETPLKKIGKVEDIANLVYFLSGEQSSFITGQVITVDGGFTL